MRTYLLALSLLATALVLPTAAASPPTCNGSHALIAYVDCAAEAAGRVVDDAVEFVECMQGPYYTDPYTGAIVMPACRLGE